MGFSPETPGHFLKQVPCTVLLRASDVPAAAQHAQADAFGLEGGAEGRIWTARCRWLPRLCVKSMVGPSSAASFQPGSLGRCLTCPTYFCCERE